MELIRRAAVALICVLLAGSVLAQEGLESAEAISATSAADLLLKKANKVRRSTTGKSLTEEARDQPAGFIAFSSDVANPATFPTAPPPSVDTVEIDVVSAFALTEDGTAASGTAFCATSSSCTSGMLKDWLEPTWGNAFGIQILSTCVGTTTANAATTITGSGTSFTTEIMVGDSICLSPASRVCATVTAIASNTSLTVGAALGNGSSQTVYRVIPNSSQCAPFVDYKSGMLTFDQAVTAICATTACSGTCSNTGVCSVGGTSCEVAHAKPILINGYRWIGKYSSEALYLTEQASDIFTPASGRWGLEFKSGGLYSINSAGTVLGPYAATTRATDAFGALTDITTNNASTSAHGFHPKLDGNAGHFMDSTGVQRALVSGDLPSLATIYLPLAGGALTGAVTSVTGSGVVPLLLKPLRPSTASVPASGDTGLEIGRPALSGGEPDNSNYGSGFLTLAGLMKSDGTTKAIKGHLYMQPSVSAAKYCQGGADAGEVCTTGATCLSSVCSRNEDAELTFSATKDGTSYPTVWRMRFHGTGVSAGIGSDDFSGSVVSDTDDTTSPEDNVASTTWTADEDHWLRLAVGLDSARLDHFPNTDLFTLPGHILLPGDLELGKLVVNGDDRADEPAIEASISGGQTANLVELTGSGGMLTYVTAAGLVFLPPQSAHVDDDLAATQGYVEAVAGDYVPLAGGTMSGQLTIQKSGAQLALKANDGVGLTSTTTATTGGTIVAGTGTHPHINFAFPVQVGGEIELGSGALAALQVDTGAGTDEGVLIGNSGAYANIIRARTSAAGDGFIVKETGDTLVKRLLGIGSTTPSSASCLAATSDRIYGDKDCDNTKDAGEEYLDAAIGSEVQAYDADLADLSDGNLSESKIDSAIARDSEVVGIVGAALGSTSSVQLSIDSGVIYGDVLAVSGYIIDSGSIPGGSLEDDAVTYAKMQNVSSTYRLLGSTTVGGASPVEIPYANFILNLLDDNSAAAFRADLGLDTGDNPLFNTVEVGHGSDSTLSRSSAGNLAVEGNLLYRAGGTDVPVADGGTGASTASGARDNLGLGIGGDTTPKCWSPQAVNLNPSEVTSPSFMGIGAGTGDLGSGATEAAKDYFVSPAALTGLLLAVDLDVAPGSGKTWTITLRKNGADTALTCNIADTNVQCQDTTHTVSISALDKVDWSTTFAGGTPAAAAAMGITWCFAPTQ